ncbi:hypothetical protein BS78_09G144400 [Paspalum vaginatum]|nr:hypothetical protein BS78_09G144400 [Paspalum vaginatum]
MQAAGLGMAAGSGHGCFSDISWLPNAGQLAVECSAGVDPRVAVAMDPVTPLAFDGAQYFRNLQAGKGLLASDQVSPGAGGRVVEHEAEVVAGGRGGRACVSASSLQQRRKRWWPGNSTTAVHPRRDAARRGERERGRRRRPAGLTVPPFCMICGHMPRWIGRGQNRRWIGLST